MAIVRFKPERPIYLNKDNTGYKTEEQVIFAIEQLRDKGWLCAYSELSRPFHMSFNSEKEFQEFKKCAKDLGITLKATIIKQDELDLIDEKEANLTVDPTANSKSSYESSKGILVIEE